MEKEFPESSNIQKIKYLTEKKELLVTFKRGGTYSYADVPEEKFTEVLKSESIGTFFAKEIKTIYACTKLI